MPATAEPESAAGEQIVALVCELEAGPRTAKAKIRELEEQIGSLNEEIGEMQTNYDELEKKTLSDDVEGAVHKVLDLVERPTGSLRATLPHTAASERALIALFDAIGRKL